MLPKGVSGLIRQLTQAGGREGNVHERMGKSDLGAIDGTIARGFDE